MKKPDSSTIENGTVLTSVLDESFDLLRSARESHRTGPRFRETGHVLEVGESIVRADGLPRVQSEEMVRFSGGQLGLALNLDPDEVGVILLDPAEGIEAGSRVHRTGKVMEIPVGNGLLGRVISPVGRPLDGQGAVAAETRLPIEREAPPILHRLPVEEPLQTGIKVIDALIPVGRGQRELILGDRQTGKTAIAIDTILNQRETNVLCIYCAIGQRSSALARVNAELKDRGALEYTVVVASTGDDPAGLQFLTPYAATSVAEFFMEQGRDVLIVYDDLTRHAWAYRELSLLLRRPPGREAYPGDIFYIHSRLLERSTRLRPDFGGGSLTALPIIETQAQNLSSYITTNLISITDGQIYLSPQLFQNGVLPAVDVGRSVSRVGGKAQLPGYRAIAGSLRLAYAQFEELERFTRYGARLDEDTQKTLRHGQRIREILKQPELDPLSVRDQLVELIAARHGLFDEIELAHTAAAARDLRIAAVETCPDVMANLEQGRQLSDADEARFLDDLRQLLAVWKNDNHPPSSHGDH